jgi:hypothetical protein
MNAYKKSIHIWITLTSFAGFLAGWAFLAQAGRQAVKPNTESISAQVINSLPVIQTVNTTLHTLPSNSSFAQGYKVDPATPTPLPQPTLQPPPPPQPQISFLKPRLKTSGS